PPDVRAQRLPPSPDLVEVGRGRDRQLPQLALERLQARAVPDGGVPVELVRPGGRGSADGGRAAELREEHRERVLPGDAQPAPPEQLVPGAIVQRTTAALDEDPNRHLPDRGAAEKVVAKIHGRARTAAPIRALAPRGLPAPARSAL